MDLEPIEERANEFATWVGKFDSAHRTPAAFASAADVPALIAEVKRLRTVYAEVDCEALRLTAAPSATRDEVARALEGEFGCFLAHDPRRPDAFWGGAADALLARFTITPKEDR